MISVQGNIDSVNEETTLFANFRRRHSQSSTIISRTLLAENTNFSRNKFKWKWHTIRFYLIEPLVVLLIFAYNLSETVLKNRIIFQTCTAIFDYNETDCQQLSNKNNSEYIKAIEEQVQPYAARLFMATTLIQCIIPAMCGPFAGAWSDRNGRKPLLIASFTGYFLYYFVTSLISHFSDLFNINPWYYIIPSLILSLLGDGVIYSVASLSYITDVSNAQEKPYRMVFYEAGIYIGLMAGSFSTAFIYQDQSSSSLIFSISAFCLLIALLVVIFVIPESLNATIHPIGSEVTHRNVLALNDGESINIFSFQHLRDMLRACFQPREYEARCVILLIISTLIICIFVVDGSMSVFYLFIRDKFQWSIKEFNTFEGLSILIPVLGNVLTIGLLRKIFHIKLLNIAILGLLSHACNYLMRGFAAVNWQLYVAIVLGSLKSIANPMLRTALSNLLPVNEMGKIFSFISVIGGFVPLLASPLYTIIYSATLQSYPGFFNIISASLFLFAIGLLLVVLGKKQKYYSYYGTIFN